jgi:hypothetical protein
MKEIVDQHGLRAVGPNLGRVRLPDVDRGGGDGGAARGAERREEAPERFLIAAACKPDAPLPLQKISGKPFCTL